MQGSDGFLRPRITGDYARGKADDHDSDSGEEEEETQGEEFKNDAMMLTSYSD